MNCKFQTIADNTHQCIQCGFTIKVKEVSERIYRNCTAEPGVIAKGIDLIKTVGEWVQQGMPITAPVDVNKRLEICNACEHYDNGTCKLCGCGMSIKARMETAHCPINKW